MSSSVDSLTRTLGALLDAFPGKRVGSTGEPPIRFLPAGDVAYGEFDQTRKLTVFHLVDGTTADFEGGIAKALRALPDRFEKIGRYSLVDPRRVTGVMGKSGRYLLDVAGVAEPVELARAYELRFKRVLDVYTLDHPTPIPPSEKVLKELELIDFGASERKDLDLEDPVAVEAHTKKWDLRRFDSARLTKYFSEITTGNIDVEKFIRNLLWQSYTWIRLGMEPLYEGNVRTYWYKVQAALGHQTDLIAKVSPRSYNRALNEMIHGEGLFKYRDIGFFDVRSRYRILGETHPEIMLIGEKIGHFHRIRKMVQGLGVTFGCTKGQSSHIMVEYFVQELVNEGGVDPATSPLHVLMITDFDWAGASIARNFVKLLRKETGSEDVHLYPLVKLADFSDEDISWGRTVAARYVLEDGKKKPHAGTTGRVLTAALAWYETVKDPRLFSEEVIGDTTVYTVWKVSIDTVDWDVIQAKARERIEALVAGKGSGSSGGLFGEAKKSATTKLRLDEVLVEGEELDSYQITEDDLD